jgi:F-type H+-transporting ATPase subunit delta
MKTPKQAQREARQLYRLCLVNGSLDEVRVRLVVERVIERARVGGLAVLTRFRRLVASDRARHRAEVASAVALPPELRADIEADLARLYGHHIDTSFIEDPGLIGGVRVTAGSDVYDGSIKGRLAALAERF